MYVRMRVFVRAFYRVNLPDIYPKAGKDIVESGKGVQRPERKLARDNLQL